MRLYNPQHDRSKTMLAYEVNFFPAHALRRYHQIKWQRCVEMTKAQVLELCDEDLTTMVLRHDQSSPPFVIHWVYNNIPTEQEWRRLDNDTKILVHYRISPIIRDGGGRVCVLSLESAFRNEGKLPVPAIA